MNQTTKKLEKLVIANQKIFKRPYAFVSETKLGTIGTWLTNGHFAYAAERDCDLVKLATIDKANFDGQRILVALDALEGYAPITASNQLLEDRGCKYLTRILSFDADYTVHMNNDYFEAIRAAFPNATIYTKDAGSSILWIDEVEKRLVAICMPLRSE